MVKPSRIYYDNCKDCHSKCEHAGKDREFVYTDAHPSCKIAKVTTKTNADRIRAMSDEELADKFASATCFQSCAFAPPSYAGPDGGDFDKDEAVKAWLIWLKEPEEGVMPKHIDEVGSEVIVVVRDGVVQAVYGHNSVGVDVLDYDNYDDPDCDEEMKEYYAETERRIAWLDRIY